MEKQTRPAWMQDELVKDIAPEKLAFLERMFTQGYGKSQKEMLALIMPMMKKAKQENLTFSPGEMNAAISAIKKHSTDDELQQINSLLKKTQKSST